MLTTRLRTLVAGILAASIVALSAGPAAPQTNASKNDWRYMHSSEAAHQRISNTFCGDMKALYDDDIADMNAAIKKNDYKASFHAQDEAAKDRETAKRYGCAWAWT